MRIFIILLTLGLLGTQAQASNMVDTAKREMERAGYPPECVAKMTNNDAAKITSWQNDPDLSSGNANRRTRDQYERICKR